MKLYKDINFTPSEVVFTGSHITVEASANDLLSAIIEKYGLSVQIAKLETCDIGVKWKIEGNQAVCYKHTFASFWEKAYSRNLSEAELKAYKALGDLIEALNEIEEKEDK